MTRRSFAIISSNRNSTTFLRRGATRAARHALGRNATAGVVNLTSAKPIDQFEAMASADIGNYGNRRFEGMINVPIVDDRVDLRIAGEWTKRQGYSFNALDDQRVDGRDLWSGRVTLGFKPTEKLQAYLVWEHFSEDDDRMRTAKQLCKTAPTPTEVGGVPVAQSTIVQAYTPGPYLSQGCLPTSLYSSDAFEVVNGQSLPYYEPLADKHIPVWANLILLIPMPARPSRKICGLSKRSSILSTRLKMTLSS